jgi:hypothetical protein
MLVPKLEPRTFIGRIEGLINVCRSAADKLTHFPKEIISDEKLKPWYKRAARLRQFTDQPHITRENATVEFIKEWEKIKAELAQKDN